MNRASTPTLSPRREARQNITNAIKRDMGEAAVVLSMKTAKAVAIPCQVDMTAKGDLDLLLQKAHGHRDT